MKIIHVDKKFKDRETTNSFIIKCQILLPEN